MKNWEYFVATLRWKESRWVVVVGEGEKASPDGSIMKLLNIYGQEGWELVSAVPQLVGYKSYIGLLHERAPELQTSDVEEYKVFFKRRKA